MSTTTPAASRVARRKVASTTYVAPCRRCAGPNTSPRRLWAIITRSRTSTAYMQFLSIGIADQRAQRAGPRQQRRQTFGQAVERDLLAQQRLEPRIGDERQGQREA